MKKLCLTVGLALGLGACASEQGLVDETPNQYLSYREAIAAPRPNRFTFCVEHGCARMLDASLSDAEWRQVVGPMATPAATPAAERAALAAAVARFEATVRSRLRLGQDQAGTYPGALAADQNDCIDETSNTTTLLLMLKDRGALAHHDVGPPAKRGVFVDIALPHRSATVVERASGGHYVLDSWFRASGVAADVAPLDQWLKGWTPEGGAWS